MNSPKTTVSNIVFLTLIVACGTFRPLQWIITTWVLSTTNASVGDFSMARLTGELARAGAWHMIYDSNQYIVQYRHLYGAGTNSDPYLYPPSLILLVTPFSYLPIELGYFLWIFAGFLALAGALRCAGASWVTVIITLASPPVLYNALLGQNGTYTASLFIGALTLTCARPASAGGLAALLTIKPHLGVLLPIAWLCERRWVSIVTAVIGIILFISMSALVFGMVSWRTFFTLAVPQMHAILDAPFPQGYQASAISVFVMLRAVGASVAATKAGQLAAAIGACIATARIWTSKTPQQIKLILTLLLALLATPYGYVYDMVGYAAALALILQRWGISPAWALFWLWPAYERDVTSNFRAPVTPLVILALVGFVWYLHHQTKDSECLLSKPI